MNSLVKEQLINEKNIFKTLRINYLTDSEIQNANFVAHHLEGINPHPIALAPQTLDDVFDQSFSDIQLLGDDIAFTLGEILDNTNCVIAYHSTAMYTCHITYQVDEQTKKITNYNGNVKLYKLSDNYDELSPLFLGHEHLHALKETNYQEYVDCQRVGDVIPLFYEMVKAYSTYQDLYQAWLNQRIQFLIESKELYQNARESMKSCGKTRDLYKLLATKSGQYLNSFYYAIILFNIYQTNPNSVLTLIEKVLKHELTTMEMLSFFNIYNPNNQQIVGDEIALMKKALK